MQRSFGEARLTIYIWFVPLCCLSASRLTQLQRDQGYSGRRRGRRIRRIRSRRRRRRRRRRIRRIRRIRRRRRRRRGRRRGRRRRRRRRGASWLSDTALLLDCKRRRRRRQKVGERNKGCELAERYSPAELPHSGSRGATQRKSYSTYSRTTSCCAGCVPMAYDRSMR
eukprot:COSAG02_NODE_7405_length_3031_cov_40.211460_3_plen_168_part_00